MDFAMCLQITLGIVDRIFMVLQEHLKGDFWQLWIPPFLVKYQTVIFITKDFGKLLWIEKMRKRGGFRGFQIPTL